VLFEIQGDLVVGDPAAQRPHDEPQHGGEQHDRQADARHQDGQSARARPLDAVSRRHDEEQRHCHDPYRAAQGQLHTPAPAYLGNDVEEFGRLRRASHVLEHEAPVWFDGADRCHGRCSDQDTPDPVEDG